MHRNIEIIVPSEHTDQVVERLRKIDSVLAISVFRGAAIEPPGGSIKLQSLNRNADEVMRCMQDLGRQARVNVATSDHSVVDLEHEAAINDDVDDSLWENIKSDLRRAVRVDWDYLALMWLGGMIASCGLFLHGPPQALAYVAAAIIAPAFQPVAKVPVGLVLRNVPVLRGALCSCAAGLLGNADVRLLLDPALPKHLISASGAIAGMLIVVTYRDMVIVGPLIAMVLVPAAAFLSVSAAVFDVELVREAASRFGVDVAFVLVFGFALVLFKQRVVHRRRPMM